MNIEIKQTKDGSYTLFVPELNEHYHSVHGALQESEHVFIKMGLLPALEKYDTINLLEVGFGTGLNAILTLPYALAGDATILYDTLEKYPLSQDVIQGLHAEQFLLNPELLDYFYKMHLLPWNTPQELAAGFTLHKLHATLEDYPLPQEHYNLIYFDAFAPEKQPELWSEEIFRKLYAAMAPGGALVTYCAKGSFKRALKAAGFTVEALPGPPGKREMVRAIK